MLKMNLNQVHTVQICHPRKIELNILCMCFFRQKKVQSKQSFLLLQICGSQRKKQGKNYYLFVQGKILLVENNNIVKCKKVCISLLYISVFLFPPCQVNLSMENIVLLQNRNIKPLSKNVYIEYNLAVVYRNELENLVSMVNSISTPYCIYCL